MGFWRKIKELTRRVSEVEHNIYNEKQDYLEVFERNIELEQEIVDRTEELNNANKRMFTLQHIWDMMNSSTPLENVLEAIVNSTQGELGYMHCSIIRKCSNEDGNYMQVIAESQDKLIEKLNKVLNITQMQTRHLNYSEDSIFADTLKQKTILQTKSIKLSLNTVFPELTKATLNDFVNDEPVKSIIVVPLFIQKREFGWFCVFSNRDEMANAEKDFLALFAKQIEMAITIADLFQEVREKAVTDALTGLYNRRYFEEALKKEVQRAQRQKQVFSIIGIDLDYLKKINDTYGHSFGDIAIKTIAKVLKRNARSVDIPARIGGEEFNVLLPGVGSEGAMIAAERIRKAIETIELDTIGHITGSLGVATYIEHSENIEELLELADQAMYTSKREGRNRVTLATPVTETSWQEIAINTFVDLLSKNKIPRVQHLSKELCLKLKAPANKTETINDTLFTVADILTKLYNPMHTSGIIKNKVTTAVTLAKHFDLSKEEIDNLKVAMLLYDIGNLMLPETILQKTSPLTEQERDEIKNHPLIASQEILKPISYIQDILPIIENHHENWDGTGYPNKISKDEIPITSQIILIIDAYFALIEARPYRAKLSSKASLELIKAEAGKKWNKNLVEAFVSIIENDII